VKGQAWMSALFKASDQVSRTEAALSILALTLLPSGERAAIAMINHILHHHKS